MSDPRVPVDEQLSAYLAGELDHAEAAALEDRLAADPGLSARLEATHEVLVALRELDAVTPPPGYERRLRERVAAARGGEGAAAKVAPLDRRRLWTAVGTVAASLVLLAGMAGALLTRGGGDSAEVALPAGPTGEAEEFLQRQAPVEEHGAAPQPTADQARSGTQRELPLVVDDEAELPDDAAVRAHFRGGGHGLLGTPRAEAEGLGRSAREALRTAAPLRSGSHPAACLDTVTAGASGPLVVARVESVRYRGAPALAYVLVGASPGADALDRVEAWIVDPRSCSTRLFQALD